MSTKLLGISGSPIKNSNTDRAVRGLLDATGMDYDFVKLSEKTLEPCRACLGCVKSNKCIVHDDAIDIADKFQNAAGVVVGGYTPYSSLDSRTKMFMERMYCLRHQKVLSAGKYVVSIITTAVPEQAPEGLPEAYNTAATQIAYWAMEEGMQNLGSIRVIGNVPCIKCGKGDICPGSGIKMLHGPEATVDSCGVSQFEENPDVMKQIQDMAQTLRDAVSSQSAEAVTST